MAAIPADRRYVRGRRCPVCDGADNDPRGSDRRCFGFLSEDGQFVHCSREEHAGGLKLSEGSQTFGHRRTGPCGCGTQHAAAEAEPAQQQRRIVREYDYYDESGVLVYQVVRFEPKAFRQRRPGPDGQWVWSLEGVRRVLYRLDRIAESEADQTVYVVEGEKDVEALESIGLVATCNPQGAGKWAAVADCAARALAGRSVVVIADADDRGRSHAADVVSRVGPIAAGVRSIELPAKDAADWIRDGGTAEQLATLAAQPSGRTPQPLDTAKDFERNEDGKIYASQRNIKLALAKLGVRIRYNTFSRRRVVEGLRGFGPRLDDDALNHLRLRIDSEFNFRLGKDFYYDVIVDHGHEQRYHPVLDYLTPLRWDGVSRLGSAHTPSWLTRYAGAEDSAYTRAVGALVLIAAVRRVRQPGCKFDEMLILESEQGKNKSSALALLAVEQDWFTDDLPLGEDTRKMIEQTVGRWIIEAGELAGMARSDVHTLKQYLGRTKDTARLAYGREDTEILRQFVLIGTTNPGGSGYLRDSTGNRRYWPVLIEEFDLTALRADRDQLWAEAAAREAAGDSIRLDPALYSEAGAAQEERRAEDPFELIVKQAFGDLTGRIPVIEAWKVLGIQNRVITQDEMTRFGTALRLHGFQRKRAKRDQELEYIYFKGGNTEWKRWLTYRNGNVEIL